MKENREITDKLAVQILDDGIERCRKALQNLEIGTIASFLHIALDGVYDSIKLLEEAQKGGTEYETKEESNN